MLLRVGATIPTCNHGQRSLEPEMKTLKETATHSFLTEVALAATPRLSLCLQALFHTTNIYLKDTV